MRTISQRVAPSASAASRWVCGTARKTSVQTAVMYGTTMTASSDARGQHADRDVRSLEERQKAQRRTERRLDVVTHPGPSTKMPHSP